MAVEMAFLYGCSLIIVTHWYEASMLLLSIVNAASQEKWRESKTETEKDPNSHQTFPMALGAHWNEASFSINFPSAMGVHW